MGSDSIKMVAFRGDSGTYSIKAMETYYAEGEILSNEYLNHLKRSIKSFLRDNRIKKAAFSFTISMNDGITINHLAALPIMKEKFLKKSILFEMEDAGVSSDLKDYYHKWEIINTSKQDNRYDILILGIKRDLINQISKIANIKYKIDHIELQPATIGRMVEGTRLVLDYGQESTRIFFFKDGKPFLIKTISLGGNDIDRVIMDKMGGLTRDELARIKQQTSIREKEQDENLDVLEEEIKESVYDLVEEIRRYTRSIELEYEIFFESIYYTGGLSNLLGLKDLFSSELAVQFKPMTISGLPGDSQLSSSETSIFFFAISAAMHKESSYLSNLDFTKLAKTQMDYSPVFITALCASLVLGAATMDISKKYDERLVDLDQYSYAQGTVITSMEDDLRIYDEQIKHNNRYVETINKLSGHNAWLSDILYVLTMETPEEVIVKSMRLVDGSVSITGYAKDYSSIAFISMALEKYGNVDINSVDNKLTEEITSQSGNVMTRGFKIVLTYDKGDRLIEDNIVQLVDLPVNMPESDENMDGDNK